MADWTFTRGSLFTPKARQRVRVTVTATALGPALYPRNYQWPGGQYYEVFTRTGDLHVRRSHSATPPFAWDVALTSSGDISYPAIWMLPRGYVAVIYQKGAGGAYYVTSYDEALTFGTPALAIANGTKPNGAVNPFDGAEIIAALIVASGKISAQSREAGELAFGTGFFFKDSTLTDMLFENDTFGLYWGHSTSNPLMGVFHLLGETDISSWRSFDLGRTWERIT